MNSKRLTHRQLATLPNAVIVRHDSAITSQPAGPHADQNRRREGRNSRGGRNGLRVQLRREALAA